MVPLRKVRLLCAGLRRSCAGPALDASLFGECGVCV